MSISNISMPRIHNFGSGKLAEISYLVTTLGIQRRTAMKWLKAMRIEPVYIGEEIFFNLDTFSRILYVLTRPGGPGFAFPGTRTRKGVLRRVTDEILKQAEDPMTLAEMEVANTGDAGVLKKLIERQPKAARTNGK